MTPAPLAARCGQPTWNDVRPWQTECVERALSEDVETQVGSSDTDDELVTRIASRRQAGLDATEDIEELLRRAGIDNRAALDRLAK